MKGAVKFVIITGLSGAGKSQAIKVFEDADYFCVDNLPPALLPKFAELCASGDTIQRAALVMDIRGGEFFKSLFDALAYLSYHEWPHEVLFLEASEEVLVRRFKETRRRHPLAGEGSIQDGIRREVEMLAEIKGRADKIINTTGLTPAQLKEEVQALFQKGEAGGKLQVRLLSFGFKKGIPLDADFVFDCRFLANPHYVPELKPLTGTDARVKQFVFGDEASHHYLAMMQEMVEFVIPHCIREGKTQLVVAIGCTGGRHRSVAMAEALKEKLVLARQRVAVEHRHIGEEV
ncbi:MAG: Nucleotide-binding protein YvcJ [Firmicutes bacterium]|nr:Nucleotide-binding protein YvcJ [candidate division NPL-UPA2 bacterium]MBT9155087.1 Nucleotide-binding protein YvcJ [candidate division NPL-UPA2 bacterium]